MSADYILTCDIGTTGCKATLFTLDLRECAAVVEEYPTIYPQPNWAEQDMPTIYSAVCRVIRSLTDRFSAEDIAVVGLTGTMNGCIPVDGNGVPLANNIIHSDARAWPQLETIREHISPEDFYRLTGCRLDYHYMLPKLLWLREENPDVFRRAVHFLNTKDFIHGMLTGDFNATDPSDASLTVALDINKGDWARDLLRDLGLDTGKMPVIRPGHDIRDRVTAQAAQQTGLKEGTPVAIGGGDGSCTARGAGLAHINDAYCYIGSSAWVSQLVNAPLPDAQERLFHYLDMDGKSVLSCGTVQCGASSFNWALRNFLHTDDFGRVEAMAREIRPGSEGVLFLPTLMGERTPYWDANTKGVLTGFSLYHDERHIARAVYEGVAFALFTSADIMRECGQAARSLMITGGGAKSGLWPQLLSSMCGIPTRVHAHAGEATSMGAAIAAGVGIGMYRDYTDAANHVTAEREYMPDAREQAAYEKIYPVYSRIYERMKPIFDEIALSGRFE